MAATLMNRLQLNQEFRDGERPSGEDFASAWMSFLNITEDGVKVDSFGNFEVVRGLKLNDAATGSQGTLRFNGGQVQFHDGSSFKNISAGAGAFVQFGPGPHVFFAAGNVGIGAFGSAPTNKLDVILGVNTGADQRVKFGNFVIHNGPVGTPGAYACHNNQPGDTSYALFQDSSGTTKLNSASGQELQLTQNAQVRFRVMTGGDIIVSPAATKTITLAGVTGVQGNLTVFGDLTVNGHAFKPIPQAWEIPISDARVKKDIRTYSEGLEKLLALKPVTYKFNGKAGTIDDDKDYVGLVAQDVQEVFPEIILKRQVKLQEDDEKEVEVLTYDSGPLTYSIINSIKELSSRILKLEKSEKHAKRESKGTSRAHN